MSTTLYVKFIIYLQLRWGTYAKEIHYQKVLNVELETYTMCVELALSNMPSPTI